MANNNTKAKQKQMNGKDRSAQVSGANARNKWNTNGKVAAGKKSSTVNRSNDE